MRIPVSAAPEVLATTTPTYHDAYALRRAASTMTGVAAEHLGRRLDAARATGDRAAGPLRILSLGCGDGDLDVPLLVAIAALGAVEYVGVDVNAASLAGFRARLDGMREAAGDTALGPEVTVTLRHGDLDEVTDPVGFDVVLLSHVLYYIPDPVPLVRRLLRELVRTDGRLLIVQSAREGIPAVMEAAGLTPFAAAEDLAEALIAAGEGVSAAVVATALDATAILAGTPEGRTLLGFLVEREPGTLTVSESEAVVAAIRARCTLHGGRATMPEMLGILELRGDLALPPRRDVPGPSLHQTLSPDPNGHEDTVLDYRLLAERFDWPSRLRIGTRGSDGRRAILDVGCGTGRWLRALAHAWPELAADRDDRTYTAVDPAPGAIEAAAEAARPIAGPVGGHRGTVERLTPEDTGRFDLVWAVHSLYAVAPEDLDAVVGSLRALLRPDAVAVIVLPDARSFYLRAGELALGRRLFVGAEEVMGALGRNGIPFGVTELAYEECIPATDDLALRRYLWDESIGNSWAPAGGAVGGHGGPQGVAPSGPDLPQQPDAAWWWQFRHGDTFRFPQHACVLTFRGA